MIGESEHFWRRLSSRPWTSLKRYKSPFKSRPTNSQLASRLSSGRVYLSMSNSSCLYDWDLCQKGMEDFWLMCTLLTFLGRCWTSGGMTWIRCTETIYLKLNFTLSMMIWEQILPFFPWLKFEFQQANIIMNLILYQFSNIISNGRSRRD